MAGKRKTRGRGSQAPDYPLLSLEEYKALSPHEKLRFLEFLKAQAESGRPVPLEKLFNKAPQLVEKCMEIYTRHFGERTSITRISLWAHLGVLALGTVVVGLLGYARILDGATVVAFIGPLYTYVLVNLRYLTGWRVVGDKDEAG